MEIHSSQITFSESTGYNAHIGEHILKIDTSVDSGGKNEGPSPKKLMLASLAGCTAFDIVSLLKKMRVEFSDFQVEAKADLTEEHPKIYQNAELIYTIKINAEDQDKMDKAVSLSQEKYCGVAAMFRAFTKISVQINYL